MTLPSALSRYEDCRAVLDTALARGGCIYRIPHDAERTTASARKVWPKAIAWVARANNYRKLLRDANDGISIYDRLILRVTDNGAITISAAVEPAESLFQIYDLNGEPIEPDVALSEDDLNLISEFKANYD